MKSVKLSRRWLMGLIPAAAVTLSTVGATQADVFEPTKEMKTNYRVMLVSLIPHAPESKKSVFLDMKAGKRVAVRQYLDLPLVLEIESHQLSHSFVDDQGREIRDYYTVRLLDEQGREIKEMNIGTLTTATFVDQRLSVFLSKAT